MTNQALLYARMQAGGQGHLLPDPAEYGRQAAAKKAKAEKWAARISGLLFGGAMLLWGRSAVSFTDANGVTVAANTVPVGQLVLGVLSQNDSIQTSQIARETIKPVFEDVCGWVAGMFYPDDEEAGMMHRMLSGGVGQGPGSVPALGNHQNNSIWAPAPVVPHHENNAIFGPSAGGPIPGLDAPAVPSPLPWRVGQLVQQQGDIGLYQVTDAAGVNKGPPVMLRHVVSPARAAQVWGPNWQHAPGLLTVPKGALIPYMDRRGPEI